MAAGGVAGQDDQVAALGEQPLAAGAGERHDLFTAAPAIGHVGLVGEEDEVGAAQRSTQGVVDAQASDPGIKNPNRHGPALALGRGGVHGGMVASRWMRACHR